MEQVLTELPGPRKGLGLSLVRGSSIVHEAITRPTFKDDYAGGPSPESDVRDALKEDEEKGFEVETLLFHRVAFAGRARRGLGLKRRKMLQKQA